MKERGSSASDPDGFAQERELGQKLGRRSLDPREENSSTIGEKNVRYDRARASKVRTPPKDEKSRKSGAKGDEIENVIVV